MSKDAPKGYLPEQIIFYIRDKERRVNGRPCKEAFPVSNESPEKTHDNAKNWADRYLWRGGKPQRTPTTEDIVENTERDGYRIVGAEQRAEGGRAWKVITPEGYLVDMREDVFLPILLKKGLPKTGMIPAKFVWAQLGSQLKLVEVGSALYKQMETAAKRKVRRVETKEAAKEKAKKRQKKRLSVKDLEVGDVYETETYGTQRYLVYLGRVMHEGKKKHAWAPIYFRGRYHLESHLRRKGVVLPSKGDFQGWFDLNREADKANHEQEQERERQYQERYLLPKNEKVFDVPDHPYRLELSASVVVEEQVGAVDLPDDIQTVGKWNRTDGMPIEGDVTWVTD